MENSILQERKYKTHEAAPLLGLESSRSVARYCAMGKLPGAYRVGRDWLIPESAIMACLQRAQGTAAAA